MALNPPLNDKTKYPIVNIDEYFILEEKNIEFCIMIN